MNANSTQKTAPKTHGEKLSPAEAAVALRKNFRKIAKKLAPKNRALQDDLAQEMALAALQCKRPATEAFFCTLGEWRARDFMRRDARFYAVPLRDIACREDALEMHDAIA